MKKVAILASGTTKGGGTGFRAMARRANKGELGGSISCVLSNHARGGVARFAHEYDVRFVHFQAPWTAERCYELIGETVDLVHMSGWGKIITGMNPRQTINSHPGPLPKFGGHGMYDMHIHRAVLKSDRCASEVCFHFVTDTPDGGPVFFRHAVPVYGNDTPEALRERAQRIEHEYQWVYTRHILAGKVHWDGVDPSSLVTI